MPVVGFHIAIAIGTTGVINAYNQLGELGFLAGGYFPGDQDAAAATRLDIKSIGILAAGGQVVE